MNMAYDYIMDHNINTEADYPYKGYDSKCLNKKGKNGMKSCTLIQ